MAAQPHQPKTPHLSAVAPLNPVAFFDLPRPEQTRYLADMSDTLAKLSAKTAQQADTIAEMEPIYRDHIARNKARQMARYIRKTTAEPALRAVYLLEAYDQGYLKICKPNREELSALNGMLRGVITKQLGHAIELPTEAELTAAATARTAKTDKTAKAKPRKQGGTWGMLNQLIALSIDAETQAQLDDNDEQTVDDWVNHALNFEPSGHEPAVAEFNNALPPEAQNLPRAERRAMAKALAKAAKKQ